MSSIRWSVLLLAAWVWAAPINSPLPAAEWGWKAGVARAKITPEEPMWLAGYAARTEPAEGTLHDLWIKVLVLEDASANRAVLVTSDLLGFPRAMSERICGELREQHGLRREQVMLTASHTHTGPVLENALYDIYPLDEKQRDLIAGYSGRLEQVVVETVGRAADAMQPAELWAGEGLASFAVNRRNNREAELPDMLARNAQPAGPVNHCVPVLAVRNSRGELLAVVFGYACHATTLSFNQWSGDYPGFAQLALEQRFPGTTAMFFAGCGADQNPLPRRSVELCSKYGEQLAAAVMEVLGAPMRRLEPPLSAAMCIVDLEYQRPDEAALKQLAASGGYRARWAERLLAEKAEGADWPSRYPYPVQVWKLGRNQLWVALGGEVVVDYANRLQQIYGPSTWVAGYANDVMSYIPSHRVWEEGGYEAGAFEVYGLPATRWQPELEQRILEAIERLNRQLQAADADEQEVTFQPFEDDRHSANTLSHLLATKQRNQENHLPSRERVAEPQASPGEGARQCCLERREPGVFTPLPPAPLGAVERGEENFPPHERGGKLLARGEGRTMRFSRQETDSVASLR